jgi:hypothetical protein
LQKIPQVREEFVGRFCIFRYVSPVIDWWDGSLTSLQQAPLIAPAKAGEK